MSVTIIVEITNKLLRHVSTHEVSFSGSSLVFAKITIEMCEFVRLTFVKNFIKLIKITNYMCGPYMRRLWCGAR
jgi:hypothetical protein